MEIRYDVEFELEFGLALNIRPLQTTNKLVDSYKALIEMVREDPSAERVSDPNAVRERQFAEDYLDENASSDRSMRMKKRITDGSRKFLEKAYVVYLLSWLSQSTHAHSCVTSVSFTRSSR